MRNTSPVALGQVIANKYQVEGVLGEGGMGIVVSAWHLGLEQRVAIKLLLQHMRQSDSSALERFQREARAAARIRSEHVCRVIDTGNLEDGTPFLVMEYLEGADLADELVRRGRFEVSEAVRYIREACLALSQAHQAGVIHRDLKPANLFLVQRPDGTRMIKVLDFGVSKSLSGGGTPNLTLTKTSALVGSPIYMSPEQLNSSKDVDGRTDLWALGTILYELITGRTPFYGESIPQLVNAVLNTEPEPFAAVNIPVSAGLELVVRRALSKPRDGRYASAMELYDALGPYGADLPGSISGTTQRAGALPTRSMSLEHSANIMPPVTSAAPPVDSGKKKLPAAVILLLLVALAGLAAVLSRRGSSETVEPTATALGDAGNQPNSVPRVPEPPKRVETALAPEALADVADAAIAVQLPEALADAQVAEPADLGSRTEPRTTATPEPHRNRDRSRASKEPAPPPSTPEPEPRIQPKPDPGDENMSNFGGRR